MTERQAREHLTRCRTLLSALRVELVPLAEVSDPLDADVEQLAAAWRIWLEAIDHVLEATA